MGRLRYKIINNFRELLVPHSKSLEFRAELLTLMILSNEQITQCEENLIKDIATEIYGENKGRSQVLYETVGEFHSKIVANNGLEYNDLITKITNDTKKNPRFAKKIDLGLLDKFKECLKSDDEIIFHNRLIEYLTKLRQEHE